MTAVAAIQNTFAGWVSRRRNARHMTVSELAELVGVKAVKIGAWEAGVYGPTKEELLKLATVLQADVNHIPPYQRNPDLSAKMSVAQKRACARRAQQKAQKAKELGKMDESTQKKVKKIVHEVKQNKPAPKPEESEAVMRLRRAMKFAESALDEGDVTLASTILRGVLGVR